MIITKKQLALLQYVYRKNTVPYSSIVKKFKRNNRIKEITEELLYNNYLSCVHGTIDENGDLVELTDSTLIQLEQLGIAEVEKHQWFNGQYIISSLIVPIVVGVVSSIITALFLAILG